MCPDAQIFTDRHVAHASERTAAPRSYWMAATAGLTPAEALAVARGLSESLRTT